MSLGSKDRFADNPSAAARRQFGAVAAAYATSAVHASGADLAQLVEATECTAGERVLDLGCGAGHTALAMALRADQVVAVDVAPEMLDVARGLAKQRGVGNIRFRRADATALPFEPASFDVVTSRYSAHHYSDPAQALREVVRVLRPGGRFLLADTVAPEAPLLDTFFNAVELLRDRSHLRNYRVSEWERLFHSAGLTPQVLNRSQLELEGSSWVERSQTPGLMVDAIKVLFNEAPPMLREAFAIRTGAGWGWTIPIALLRGTAAPGPG